MSETPSTLTEGLPEGYRMTELGPLPEEWRVVRLGEIIRSVKGRKPSVVVDVPLRDGLPYLTAEYFRSNTANLFVPKDNLIALERCEESDIVLIWDGSSAGQVFTGLKGVLASTMVRLDLPDDNSERAFLYFYLLTQFELLNAQTTGSMIPHVNKNVFFNLPIPLPPLAEQRAIAHVLHAVQEAKEATARVIAAARELKKSLMRHLFTYGPVPADQTDQVPMQETELGPLPAHWRVVRLGEAGEIVTGKTPPTSNDEYWDGTIPFITPVDLDGRPIVCASRTISKKGLTKTKSLPRNSVLVSCIGYIGKTGLVDTDLATTNQQINAIIPHKEIASSLYLLYVLTYLAPNLAARARMTTVPILSKSGLSAFPIPLPPLAEQQEIARILQAVDAKIRAEEARKDALEGLFRSLLHHLMTAKVRLPKDLVQQFTEGKP